MKRDFSVQNPILLFMFFFPVLLFIIISSQCTYLVERSNELVDRSDNEINQFIERLLVGR